MKPNTVEEYASLIYDVVVDQDTLPGGVTVFVARHPELRGCLAHGITEQEALSELAEVRKLHMDALLSHGVTPPLPMGGLEPIFRIVLGAQQKVTQLKVVNQCAEVEGVPIRHRQIQADFGPTQVVAA